MSADSESRPSQARGGGDCDAARPLVSVVVPAYNEEAVVEKNLGALCSYMETLEEEYRWEVIFVNDGSTDRTGDLAEQVAGNRDNVTVLHHTYNFRLGQALRSAFSRCHGDYVVTIDLDLSYSLDHIERLLATLRETKAKIVIASPYMKGGKVSNVPWLRRVLSVWANRFLALTVTRDRFSASLSTITGMVRGYDAPFLSRLNLKAMDVDICPEIIYKAMILRARIVEVPAHLDWGEQRGRGQKRRPSVRIVWTILSNLISGFMFRPFMFFTVPGTALLLLSLYPIAWIFIHTYAKYQSIGAAGLRFDYRLSEAIAAAFRQSPHAFIVGGIAFLVGLQLVSLGLLALQNKRYFEELYHLGSTLYRVQKEDGKGPEAPP